MCGGVCEASIHDDLADWKNKEWLTKTVSPDSGWRSWPIPGVRSVKSLPLFSSSTVFFFLWNSNSSARRLANLTRHVTVQTMADREGQEYKISINTRFDDAKSIRKHI